MTKEEPDESFARAVLEQLGCGVIACSGLGRLIYANALASRCLADARLISLYAGHIRPAQQARGELDTALRCAMERGLCSLAELSREGERLLAVVVPLQPTRPGSDVLVIFSKRSLAWDLGIVLLAGSYGLTPPERRVLAALAVGVDHLRNHLAA